MDVSAGLSALPSDADLQKAIEWFVKQPVATKGTSALDEASCSAQATAQAGEEHHLSPKRKKVPPTQTMSPPLAIGKLYRADQHVCSRLAVRGDHDASNPSDLIGAYYPHVPAARTLLGPYAVYTDGNQLAPTAGTPSQPGTPTAQYSQPPPPPPRPVNHVTDDEWVKREQLYQDKMKALVEREKWVTRCTEALKLEKAFVVGVHAENKSTAERHLQVQKELDERANILRVAAQQQQVKEAELNAREAAVQEALRMMGASADKCRQVAKTEAAPTSPILCVQAADCTVCLAPTSLNDVIERELVEHKQTMAERLKALKMTNSGPVTKADVRCDKAGALLKMQPATNAASNKDSNAFPARDATAVTGRNQAADASGSTVTAVCTDAHNAVPVTAMGKGCIKVLYRERKA